MTTPITFEAALTPTAGSTALFVPSRFQNSTTARTAVLEIPPGVTMCMVTYHGTEGVEIQHRTAAATPVPPRATLAPSSTVVERRIIQTLSSDVTTWLRLSLTVNPTAETLAEKRAVGVVLTRMNAGI